MTEEGTPALKHGVSVLLDPKWGLMVFDRFDDSRRRAFMTGLLDGQVRLLVPAKMKPVGDLDADGWIHAPAGGWDEDPIPGVKAKVRLRIGWEGHLVLPGLDSRRKHDNDLNAPRYDIIAFRPASAEAKTPAPSQSGAGDMEGVVERVEKYLIERAKMRQIDPNDIHGLHIGGEREAVLTTADIRALLSAHRKMVEALESIAKRTEPHPDDTLADTAKDALKANAIAKAALTGSREP